MARGLQILVPPVVEPILLDDMKNYLKVDFDDDDTLISSFISAARELTETFTARSYVNKTYIETGDSFPYFVDTTMSQQAYPPSYYSLPRYATTFWNYSQQIKLSISPLVTVKQINFLGTDQQWHAMVPGFPLWKPLTAYPSGAIVDDGNGNQQEALASGNSAAIPPNVLATGVSGNPPSTVTWATNVGGVTTETTGLQWKNLGPDPNFSLGPSNLNANTFLYDAVSEPPRIFPGPAGAVWPSVIYAPKAVEIIYVSGMGDGVEEGSPASYVPPPNPSPSGYWERGVTAMMQLVSGWYENRESISPLTLKEMPNHVKMLLWSSRVLDLAATIG